MAEFPTDPAEARTELLRRLPSCGFVPPAEWAAAARGRAESAPDSTLRNDVETFVAAFWSLPPHERRPRWQSLLNRAGDDPAAAARLRRLEAGVDLEAVPASGDRATMLAQHVQSLYVLKPIERVARRNELTRRIFWPVSDWETAAQALGRQQPSLAALDPVVQRLAETSERSRVTDRNRPRVRAAMRGSGGKREWPGVAVAIFIVVAIVRVVTGLGSSPATRPPTPYRPQVTPTDPPKWNDPALRQKKGEDLADYLKRLREDARKRGGPPPAAPKDTP